MSSTGDDQRLSREARGDVSTIAKGGAVQVIGQISQRSVAFFFGAVFVRLLGSAGYGLYRQVFQILSNLAQLGLAGFNYASMRYITLARGRKDPGGVKGAARVGIYGSLISSALVVIALLIFARPIASAFAEPGAKETELVRYLRIGAIYVPLFALLQVLRYCTQAYKTMVPSVIAGNIVQPIARFVFGVALLVAGFEVVGAIVSLLLSMVVALVLVSFYFYRLMSEAERTTSPSAPVGEMVRFALPQGGSSLLGVQALGLGILILGITSSDRDVGLFAIALSLQGPGNVFLGGIVNIWQPVVSDLHGKGEMARLGSLYKTINRWIATFSYPVFVALILEPDVFVRFYGPKASGAETIVAILAVGNLFYTGTGPTGFLISMTGHPGVNLMNSVAAVIVYLGLGFWLVPDHGLIAMAWIDVGVTAAVNSARVFQAYRLLGIQPFGRSFLKPVGASLIAGAIVLSWRLVPGSGLLIDVAGLCLGTVGYLVSLRVMGLDEEEAFVFDRIKARAFKGRSSKSQEPGSG